VHFKAYFYGEMTFILVNGETSKRQEKQLFAGRLAADNFEDETNSSQMRFVE